jgi:hypothetical protein
VAGALAMETLRSFGWCAVFGVMRWIRTVWGYGLVVRLRIGCWVLAPRNDASCVCVCGLE